MIVQTLGEETMLLVAEGEVVALPASPGDVIRVRMMNGYVVLDRLARAEYDKRYGVGGVGGSVTPVLGNP